MKPLEMRGMKGKSSGSAASRGAGQSANGDGINGHNGKSTVDLMITHTSATSSSTDGRKELGDVEALRQVRSDDELLGTDDEGDPTPRAPVDGGSGDNAGDDRTTNGHEPTFKVYKRRLFGLIQLVLLNIIVSWDWLSFSANSTTAAEYYNVTSSSINWLSTAFMFSFVVASPFVVYTLHRGGPKPSIIIASILIFLGNWIRYGATRAGEHGNFGGVMFGQILTGLAQPFVLAAPTKYSDLWFTNRGRVAATAVMSLANPLGGALAQLIDPAWVHQASDIPNMVLYISIIATVATIPSFFITAKPPTPSSHSGTQPKQQIIPSIKFLFSSPEFWMIVIPYTFYVGLFNSVSSLLNQILQPYSFTEDDAGIAGALLIVVGLVTSAITSPIIDKTKSYLLAIKFTVPIIATCYLAFTWAPQTRTIVAPYVILSILGAASFSLVPVVLEYLIEITHPVSPEVTSTICWTGGQLLGGIFIIVSDALRAAGRNDGTADDRSDRPPGNMFRTLVFQTVMALVVVPLPLALGCCGRQQRVKMKRVDADRQAAEGRYVADSGQLAA
ncbi:cell surface receptor major facilitator superfamily transporter transporter [Diplocarpon rosae]|nr:cell surface receptor major facilitator superfamily transporter transporter [Diplocarpon rosae]